jgi:SAM-dependent methyltransferase
MNIISPSPGKIQSKDFVTYRRLWLDACLEAYRSNMRGKVLDIGGKREHKRGTFQPPQELVEGWWYVNLDWSTKPDIFADVANLPVVSESIDVILCTEVLEHLENPPACIQGIYRILKSGCTGFFSVPFMYPVHADPFDFHRFSADGLRQLLCSFQSVTIISMGGYLGTVAMLMEIGLPGISGSNLSKNNLRRSLTWLARRFYQADLQKAHTQPDLWKKFTSSYFIRVVK